MPLRIITLSFALLVITFMWSSPQPSQTPDNRSIPAASKIPPPPNEMIIRTMESDIASLAASGGNKIRPEVLRMMAGITPAESTLDPSSIEKKTPVGTIIVIVLGFLVLMAAIYFSFFFKIS